ncbi:sensor histidine kinase [Arcicella rigui]|uniref:histidine kinase n=1 Tax=Arcicella rigui TaxID=797020 RepID=A0ABU5QEY1_9BACT|nr:histidine kinase dimerization/phosphoacceptor domain -containing protein [Arcicella rigui]MEA5141406.1 histidine kinase dimerization/phosphoacceptor domain -containing protein [Arcicella rigui]
MPLLRLKYTLTLLILIFFVVFAKGQNPYPRLLEAQKRFNQANASRDSAEIAEATYILAKRFIDLGYDVKGQRLLLRALAIKKALNRYEDVGKVFLRMGEIETNIEKALNYRRQALNYSIKAKSINVKMGAFRALGYNYMLLERSKVYAKKYPWASDSAITYAKKTMLIAESLKNPVDLIESYLLMSQIMSSKDLEKSIYYKRKLLDVCKANKLNHRLIDYYLEMAKQYILSNKLPVAKIWLDSAETYFRIETKIYHRQQVAILQTKASYYEKLGNWQKAFSYQVDATNVELRLLNEYRNVAMKTVNIAYENEIKNQQLIAHRREIELQKKNIEAHKQFTIVITILLLLAGIVCLLLGILFIKYKKISRLNALLLKEQNHRTKNNLQSVSDLLSLQLYGLSDQVAVEALQEGLLRVEAMLSIHGNLYRGEKLIEVNLQRYIPDLVNNVLRTYHIQEMQTDYTIAVDWLHVEKATTLGLIINELVTNACKYAFANHTNPHLQIICTKNSGIISLKLCDNGNGFSLEETKSKFGLKLIHLLCEQINAKGKYSFKNGCCFELSFEL